MRAFACLALAGCSFVPGRLAGERDAAMASDDDALVDSRTDTPPPPICGTDPNLLVCFSFDAPTFGTTLQNEGTANVAAQLTAVGRSGRDGGGAIEVTTASKIYIPGDVALAGVRAIEMWARLDVAPATDGARIGLIDADATASAMSFFYYATATAFRIRYEIGVQLFLPRTVTLGNWVHFAQVCDNGTLTAYIDGSLLGTSANCNPATAAAYGLIIAANNNQNGNKDSELTGAIDSLRIWTTTRTATQICEAAGRTSCP